MIDQFSLGQGLVQSSHAGKDRSQMASTTSAQATLSFERYESHCGHARDGGRDLHLKLGKEKKQAPPQLSLSVFSRFTFSFAGLLLLSLLA